MAAEPLSRFPAARTSDCDEAQEALTATFLPLRMRMAERPDPGAVGMRLNALRVADVTVAYARFGRGVEADHLRAAVLLSPEPQLHGLSRHDLSRSSACSWRAGRTTSASLPH
jgi:hypothetical protein